MDNKTSLGVVESAKFISQHSQFVTVQQEGIEIASNMVGKMKKKKSCFALFFFLNVRLYCDSVQVVGSDESRRIQFARLETTTAQSESR
jgi:hypothetical protein